jgi:hypothetical protein
VHAEVEVTEIILTKVSLRPLSAGLSCGSFSDLRFPSIIWASLWIFSPQVRRRWTELVDLSTFVYI